MPKLGIHLTKKPLCYKCYYNNAHIREYKNVQNKGFSFIKYWEIHSILACF